LILNDFDKITKPGIFEFFRLIFLIALGSQTLAQPVWNSSSTAIGSTATAIVTKPMGTISGDLSVAGIMIEKGLSLLLQQTAGHLS